MDKDKNKNIIRILLIYCQVVPVFIVLVVLVYYSVVLYGGSIIGKARQLYL